jgi:transposase
MKEFSMKKGQDTRGYESYMALDIHREYLLVGAWNEAKDWVLTPRRASTEKFPEWAKKNIRAGDIVVLETTTNVWATYDIVAPLASRVLVANAAEVGEIANARVKTDKEDIKRLLKLLLGGIVPEVWVPPMPVRELRAFISYRGRLVTTSTMIRNRLQSLQHKHNLKISQAGLLDQAQWEGQKNVSALEKMQIRQELVLLQEVEKLKAAVDEELECQSTGAVWGQPALRIMQLPGMGFTVAMTVLLAIGDISRFEGAKQLVGQAGLGAGSRQRQDPPRKKDHEEGKARIALGDGGSLLAGCAHVSVLEGRIRKTPAPHAQTQSGNCGRRPKTVDRHLAWAEQRRNG